MEGSSRWRDRLQLGLVREALAKAFANRCVETSTGILYIVHSTSSCHSSCRRVCIYWVPSACLMYSLPTVSPYNRFYLLKCYPLYILLPFPSASLLLQSLLSFVWSALSNPPKKRQNQNQNRKDTMRSRRTLRSDPSQPTERPSRCNCPLIHSPRRTRRSIALPNHMKRE